eukprot:CAMPEP_0115490488 /NCGR_PEP_ID=MMETSP0271-20121206/62584_1 /TAXON_ID=71861 /ORGANISM="Scrippsiella trochoidea, Strain CCMP3099" /LENGTH=66 /DNA_ID=CAMNT_0002918745 /DNA_START=219 /DNA_END=420 /DNA_ORIENTATION=+
MRRLELGVVSSAMGAAGEGIRAPLREPPAVKLQPHDACTTAECPPSGLAPSPSPRIPPQALVSVRA